MACIKHSDTATAWTAWAAPHFHSRMHASRSVSTIKLNPIPNPSPQAVMQAAHSATDLLARNFLKTYGVWFFPPMCVLTPSKPVDCPCHDRSRKWQARAAASRNAQP